MNKEDIKKLRDKTGLNLSKFAALFPVDYHTVASWESGGKAPHRSNVTRLKSLWSDVFGAVYIPTCAAAPQLMVTQVIEHKEPYTKKKQLKGAAKS